MRKKNKLVHGVGVNDFEGHVNVDGRIIKSYSCWKSMLERCYCPKYQSKMPTYIGCSVCEDWKYFSNFKNWYDSNYREGMQLDKDILVEGNKTYSPETCRFVPNYVNSLLNDYLNGRGNLPLGVSKRETLLRSGYSTITYQTYCWNGNGSHLSKTFKTLEEAVAWYSETKTRIVREVAQKALDAGEIQQDIFDALVSRKF